MALNVNGTDIYGVTFNGSPVYQINLNGTPAWYAAPSALEIAQLVASDFGTVKIDKYTVQEKRLTKLWTFTHDAAAVDKTYDIANPMTIGETFKNSPYTSNIMLAFGEESGGGVINNMYYTLVGSSTKYYPAVTKVTNHVDEAAVEAGVGFINNSLSNIDTFGANVDGFGGDTGGRFIQMLLPNKWEAFDLNTSQTGSTTLASGEMMLFSVGHKSDSDRTSDFFPTGLVTTTATLTIYGEGHWYDGVVFGLYINTTSSTVNVSWIVPEYGTVTSVKLRQIGIS